MTYQVFDGLTGWEIWNIRTNQFVMAVSHKDDNSAKLESIRLAHRLNR